MRSTKRKTAAYSPANLSMRPSSKTSSSCRTATPSKLRLARAAFTRQPKPGPTFTTQSSSKTLFWRGRSTHTSPHKNGRPNSSQRCGMALIGSRQSAAQKYKWILWPWIWKRIGSSTRPKSVRSWGRPGTT